MEQMFSEFNEQLQKLEALIVANGQKQVLNLDEVAVYTGLSKSYLYKLSSTGGIPCYKPRAKMLYFNREEIDQWLLQNRVKTKAEIDEEAATYVTTHKTK